MIDGVEITADVGVEQPVHLASTNPDGERVQRVVLAALRAEPVREAEEIRLVDGVEHFDDGPLDNLVLQRALPAFFRAARGHELTEDELKSLASDIRALNTPDKPRN